MNNSNGNNKNGPPLTVALIGCGRISQVHLQTLVAQPRARLVAVADIDEKSAKSAGEAFHVQAFKEPETLLSAVRPDAVILCTPPNTHRPLVEMALEAGAHVLCEKPLTLSVEDAQAMIEASEAREKVLMMASKFRYVADIVRTKNLIESGILGEIVLFENEFCSRVDMKRRWNAKRDVAGGGVLIDNGSHSVDIFRYLVGPIDDLQAIHGKNWQQLEVEDTCHLHLRGVDGTMGSIDLSWSIHKENPYYIHIYGTEGILEVGWKGSRYRQSEKLDWVNFGTGYDKLQAVGAQLSNFIDTITGKAQPIITTTDAIESVRVVQRAYQAAVENRWEKVAP